MIISYSFTVLYEKFYHENSEHDEVRRLICFPRRPNNIVTGMKFFF